MPTVRKQSLYPSSEFECPVSIFMKLQLSLSSWVDVHSQRFGKCNYLYLCHQGLMCVQTFLKLSLSPSLPTDMLSLMTERMTVPGTLEIHPALTHVAAGENFIVFYICYINLILHSFTMWISVINRSFKRLYTW
jgi:hypothetical protein